LESRSASWHNQIYQNALSWINDVSLRGDEGQDDKGTNSDFKQVPGTIMQRKLDIIWIEYSQGESKQYSKICKQLAYD
jgi:hypothetical protein